MPAAQLIDRAMPAKHIPASRANANGIVRDDGLHTKLLQRLDIGTIVNFVRRYAVFRAMSGQENWEKSTFYLTINCRKYYL